MKKIHVILVFVAAFLIRLLFINQSLWLDEATTARVVSQYNYFDIFSKFSLTDFHPPLYYLFMKLWTNAFGYSEVALRMPSVLFSLGTGYLLYLMGGIWAAMFFLFNPLIVYYSQEARMYLMVTFFLTGAMYYLRKLTAKNLSHIIFFNVYLILSFFTFYGSIFLIVPMFIYLLYKKNYRVLISSALMFGAYVALLSPLTLAQLKNSKIALSQVTNWASVLGTANLKNLLLIPMKFSVGRIDFYPKWAYYLVSFGWTAYVAISLRAIIKKENWLWGFLLASPLALGLVFSFFSPLLQYFRFLYLIPLMALIMSSMKDTKKNLFKTVLVIGFMGFSLVYLFVPQFHREDWKSLAKSLDRKSSIYMVMSSSDPVTYYRKDLKLKDMREMEKELNDKSVTVIPYTADIHGIDYKKILSGKGYTLQEAKSFRDLTYEVWVK